MTAAGASQPTTAAARGRPRAGHRPDATMPGPHPSQQERVRDVLPGSPANARTVLFRVGWVACATLLALGSAGIVTGMQHQPGTAARAELTYGADNRIAPGPRRLGRRPARAHRRRRQPRDARHAGARRDHRRRHPGDAEVDRRRRAIIDTIESKTAALRTRLADAARCRAGRRGPARRPLPAALRDPDRGARCDRRARRQMGHAHRRQPRGDPARDVAARPRHVDGRRRRPRQGRPLRRRREAARRPRDAKLDLARERA